MKIKEILLIYVLCISYIYGETNISISEEKSQFIKLKKDFFSTEEDDNNITIKYFEGSYEESQVSSFVAMLPVGELTEYQAMMRGYYYKVFYRDSKIVKGESISDDKIIVKIYYDDKGRKIKKYWYPSNDFEIIRFNGNSSLEYIYCEAKNEICTYEYNTKEEDTEKYKEDLPIILFVPN